ncbi:aspartyl protease family protein [uncultured Algibacter sp.]|uniref:retropepsin-like aspartic protease n=1 Tax=uncultured Algibacter sp. TaxID=298659 RepID=UPI0030EEC877|tara:strand:+ start:5939 stop:7264 length:1326 start_codon:yes stop_codon:yes gene_type:complete
MKKRILVIILFFCLYNFSFSQGKFIIQNNKQSDKIKFKLINNIIVIPVEINGVTLSFLLDTGVSKPIIFNFLNVSDTLKIKNTETISLRGLGEGESVDALKSKRNIIKIGDAINLNQDLYAVYDVNLNFAPRLGFPVHGIIGYDLFKDFVVEINYSNKFLRLTQPKKYTYKKCKKCERLNLEFYNSKPYINAEVWTNKRIIPVKLLIDSGGSDALWLFEDDSLGIKSSDKYFYDFLGHGLSGSVYGKRSKVENFALKNFVLDNVNVSYPDSTFISYARKHKNRNGSLSGNILKRFNVIFDYQRAIITLKKNNLFNDEFNYNKSGIELAHDGMRILRELNKSNIKQNSTTQSSNNNIILDNQYQISLKPAYAIVELRKDSPAEQAGLKIGDILISINGKQTYQLRLNQIIQMFYDDDGKKIRMRVDRGGDALIFNFKLKKLF